MTKPPRFNQVLAIGAAICLAGCDVSSPSRPSQVPLAGRWLGALTQRRPCVGDWTRIVLTLQPDGAGEIVTNDGAHFALSEVVENGVRRLDARLPSGPGECSIVSFVVSFIERDRAGTPTAFSGLMTGSCCGTIYASYRLTKAP
jgi:hypothetical protein